MEPDFDIDVTFEETANEKLVASLTPDELASAIAKLPAEIYSDVSQSLGLRQPELVRAVHRAKLLISESK
jgi:hypothetical protein